MSQSSSSWASFFKSQYEDDTLNNNEEVGNVYIIVDNITISHFRQYSVYFTAIFMPQKRHSKIE